MDKEKIEKIFDEKLGHRKLFIIGLILNLIACTISSIIPNIFIIVPIILSLLGVSAIILASDIKNKK